MKKIYEKKYTQITSPDALRLAEMLLKAKGTSRTMAQFSEVCGVNTSTLSRIANGNIKRPLTMAVLHDIYKQRDLDAGFSFEDFMAANGMISEEKEGEMSVAERMIIHNENRREYENFKRHSRNAIISAMINRGMVVQKIPQSLEQREEHAPFGMELPFDYNFYLEDSPCKLWYIKVMPSKDSLYAMSRNFTIASRFFILDAWMPEFFNGSKTTFVFSDETVMEQFVRSYEGAPIKTPMSAMLVDMDTEQVKDEVWLSAIPEIPGILSLPETGKEGYIASWELDEDGDIGMDDGDGF